MAYKYKHMRGLDRCMSCRRIKYRVQHGWAEVTITGYGDTVAEAQLNCFNKIMTSYPNAERLGSYENLVPYGYTE